MLSHYYLLYSAYTLCDYQPKLEEVAMSRNRFLNVAKNSEKEEDAKRVSELRTQLSMAMEKRNQLVLANEDLALPDSDTNKQIAEYDVKITKLTTDILKLDKIIKGDSPHIPSSPTFMTDRNNRK
jgi:hypothetical protein